MTMSNNMTNMLSSDLPKIPLDKVVRRISEVSSLPHIAMRTIEVCNDPNSDASALKQVIESDAALSSRVLRSVNSASNSLVRRITCVQQAVSYLGFEHIRNMAITASVSSIFCDGDRIGSYSRSGLWKHLVWTGVTARFIASRCGVTDFEDVFLAGLLHDLGIILEDQYCHQHFEYIVSHMSDEDALPRAEQRVLGFDHAVLGKRIAETWRFPEQVTTAIRFHHMADKYRGEHVKVIACVALANYMVNAKGARSIGVGKIECAPGVLEVLDLGRQDLMVIATDLVGELEQYQCLLEIVELG